MEDLLYLAALLALVLGIFQLFFMDALDKSEDLIRGFFEVDKRQRLYRKISGTLLIFGSIFLFYFCISFIG